MELRVENRNRWAIVALFVAIILLAGFAAPKHADASITSAEWQLGSLINAARARAGKAALSPRTNISDVAHRWSANMASRNLLYHNPNLATAIRRLLSWRYLGENVGYAGSVKEAFNAFMASAPHKANILNGRFNKVGLGVVVKNGRYWVTIDFVG
jgi:uncharacterized protein YkwD